MQDSESEHEEPIQEVEEEEEEEEEIEEAISPEVERPALTHKLNPNDMIVLEFASAVEPGL